MSVQVRAPRQKGANAISPGKGTDPQIMLKAPQVQDSICIANPSEEKKQVGKEACELLTHSSRVHCTKRECLALKSCVMDHVQHVHRIISNSGIQSMKSEPRTQDFNVLVQ